MASLPPLFLLPAIESYNFMGVPDTTKKGSGHLNRQLKQKGSQSYATLTACDFFSNYLTMISLLSQQRQLFSAPLIRIGSILKNKKAARDKSLRLPLTCSIFKTRPFCLHFS
jgi:hypothetical protein